MMMKQSLVLGMGPDPELLDLDGTTLEASKREAQPMPVLAEEQ